MIKMICIPITANTTGGAVQDLRAAERIGNMSELRLDYHPGADLGKILHARKKPVIVTVRLRSEGGYMVVSDAKRERLFRAAIHAGVEFVDVELRSKKILKNVGRLVKQFNRKTKVIVSYHNFSRTSKNEVSRVYRSMKRLGADVMKIVTMARSLEDNLVIRDLLRTAKREKVKLIALCMGPFGEISRVLGVASGSFLTYGSLDDKKSSAPGQIRARVLKEVYRIDELRNPKVYGLVGNPIAHSKGYLLHNAWMKRGKKRGIYVNFLVERIGKFVHQFGPLLSGFSVTIPHKTTVLRCLDRVDRKAQAIGAVNTVVRAGRLLRGYNTDVTGIQKALEEDMKLPGTSALVFGSGGVARAIVYGLVEKKVRVIVTNRTHSKAKALARQFGCECIRHEALATLSNIDLIVNGTSLGMEPAVGGSPIAKSMLKTIAGKRAVVFDSVYSPEQTKLLQDARSLRLKTISGISLFFHQAREQFKLWHGSYPRGGIHEISSA